MQLVNNQHIWTISNGLSFLRLLLAVPIIFLARDIAIYRWWILALCFFAYITDLSDGFIARHFNQESEFGRIIDPLADKIFVGVFAIVLTIQSLLPLWFLIVVLGRDALIFSGGIFLKKKKGIVAQSNYTGKIAVVTIGICLLLSLFRNEMNESIFIIALASSTLMLAVSFVGYMLRFTKVIKQSN